jgi:lauroyl/myristoyl acyltransferase
MEPVLYWLVRGVIGLVQLLPLPVVARLGRLGGALAYRLDARHRRVALKNLAAAFGTEQTPAAIRALARENFRRIGENFACAAKTAGMPQSRLDRRIEVVGAGKLAPEGSAARPGNRIIAIGHFGNFELYARLGARVPAYQFATTYRGLRQPSLDRLLQQLRTRSGCLFFERRRDGPALRAALSEQRLMLGLLADQHAGQTGRRVPFFGRDCSTSIAPAVFALRYHCPLHSAFCYRVGLARWRVEVGDEIPTHEGGHPRAIEAIALDMNRAFETAVRRDPANWFWVHNRWKSAGRPARGPKVGAGEAPAVCDPGA